MKLIWLSLESLLTIYIPLVWYQDGHSGAFRIHVYYKVLFRYFDSYSASVWINPYTIGLLRFVDGIFWYVRC